MDYISPFIEDIAIKTVALWDIDTYDLDHDELERELAYFIDDHCFRCRIPGSKLSQYLTEAYEDEKNGESEFLSDMVDHHKKRGLGRWIA